ncbi:hypothetical protein EVAR_3664_1 [Eumeta japonica]|uniref:Uncharacterized protein n=1 Tax=Eumeta variegata TaxID=151549 RepID=A0A4C1SRX9_EUMVA|nr:hypothetical protein EVAR_3664_1 [Eumeta japonica]
MKKVPARWIPKMLTLIPIVFSSIYSHEKWNRGTISHHYDPEGKLQSRTWKTPSSPTSKAGRSARKIMGYLFWGIKGVVMMEYLYRGAIVTGFVWRTNEKKKKLHNEIRKKQRDKPAKNWYVPSR